MANSQIQGDRRDIRKALGQTIRQFRLALDLTSKEFGDSIGKDEAYVEELEGGLLNVDVVTLQSCADTFGTDVAELFMFDAAAVVVVSDE